MDVTPEQIAVMAGAGVSVLVWLAKALFPKYDCAATIFKVGPVIMGSILTVGFVAQWQGGAGLVWQMLIAVVSAFLDYKIIGRPILDSVREDGFKAEVAVCEKCGAITAKPEEGD